ncbi:hypothetical protein, partial [Nocardia cyriacigeorgica]|uniref:hypothetical protein n=1 Tax=Nocardia cyriacigeorgica TaxID=135487 RepID=UPI002456144C
PYPVGAGAVTEFARGLEQLVVVDKTAFIETQIREILYGTAGAPRLNGQQDERGAPRPPAPGGAPRAPPPPFLTPPPLPPPPPGAPPPPPPGRAE